MGERDNNQTIPEKCFQGVGGDRLLIVWVSTNSDVNAGVDANVNTGGQAELVVAENGKNKAEALASVAKGNETVEWACSMPQLMQASFLFLLPLLLLLRLLPTAWA